MRQVISFVILFTLVGCSGTSSTETTTDANSKEIEKLVSNYKKIPAYPFQFTYEDLHVEPVEISKEQQKKYFDLGDDISAQALHYYDLEENFVLFTMWNPVPMPANGQVHMQADMFSKTGEKLGSIAPIPYQTSHREYKSNPKFEVYEGSIQFVIEEIFYMDEIVEGPADGLPDQVEFRSFYAESYTVNSEGFEPAEPTPFWMKIPRNFFSPFVTDYLRKDGVFEHIVTESERGIEFEDKTDKQYRASFYKFDDGVIGISSTFEDERTEEIVSIIDFIEIKDQRLIDKTDEVLGKFKDLFLSQDCDCSELNNTNSIMTAFTTSAKRSNFPYAALKDGEIQFYCFNSKETPDKPLFRLKYKSGILSKVD